MKSIDFANSAWIIWHVRSYAIHVLEKKTPGTLNRTTFTQSYIKLKS
jgi:hypothetical protein